MKKADMVHVNTEEAPPCNELFVDVVNCGTVGDTQRRMWWTMSVTHGVMKHIQ